MNMYITVKGLPNLIYSFHNIEKCTTMNGLMDMKYMELQLHYIIIILHF